MAGTPITRQAVDEALTQLGLVWRGVCEQTVHQARNIDAMTQAELETAPFSYTTDEAYAIKLAVEQLLALAAQYAGGPPPAAASDTDALMAQFTGLD